MKNSQQLTFSLMIFKTDVKNKKLCKIEFCNIII